nr:PREDICTED: uncharacterized protein LOC109032160 [Bemisia tabaci]
MLRLDGGLNDHPSPLTLIYRLRGLLLCKNPGMIQEKTNTVVPPEEECDFLVRDTFQQAELTSDKRIPRPEEEIAVAEDVSSKASSTSVSLSDKLTNMEKDGLTYIAGALARRLKNRFPYLGQYTKDGSEVEFHEHNYCLPTWISHLSYGGLIEPSSKWFSQVLKMEKYFRKLHKETFKFRKNVVKNTISYVSRKVSSLNIDPALVKIFCSTRVVVRIRFLNFRRQQMLEAKRAQKILEEKKASESAASAKTQTSESVPKLGEKRKSTVNRSNSRKRQKTADKQATESTPETGQKRKYSTDRKTVRKMRKIVK